MNNPMTYWLLFVGIERIILWTDVATKKVWATHWIIPWPTAVGIERIMLETDFAKKKMSSSMNNPMTYDTALGAYDAAVDIDRITS